jgi:hypothetical protein
VIILKVYGIKLNLNTIFINIKKENNMHRIDNSRFLLYIEPKKENKSEEPIYDEITDIVGFALSESKEGVANYSSLSESENFRQGSGYKGFHQTECGKRSSNKDYLLKNGMITNSLAVYYVTYYRDSIPESEMKKVNELVNFYKNKA